MNRPPLDFRWMRAGAAVGIVTATLSLAAPAPAVAQADDDADPNFGRVSLDFGVDFATHYFFRGLPQENQGLIAQPWSEIGFNLFGGGPEDAHDFVDSIDFFVGTWNSVHTNKTRARDSGPSNWYEADFYTGASVGLFEHFEIGLVYTAYMYPNGAFDSINEAGVFLGYEHPDPLFDVIDVEAEAGFFFELDSGSEDQKVFVLSVEPGIDLVDPFIDTDVTARFSVPMTLGLDMDAYYGPNTFGFFDVGARLSVPLPFIPRDFGAWDAYIGGHYIRLGNQAAAEGFPEITDGSRDFVYGTVGFSMSY